MQAQILDNIAPLHVAMYDKMAAIAGIAGLTFLGFDDGKNRPTLPKVAMHMSFGGYDVDRGRMIHPVYKATAQETYFYDGEEFTIDSEFEVKRPLSVDLFYEIDTWCHDSQTSLAMDLALQATFPERGVLNLPIDANNVAFPVELLGIQDLDDLTENIREKVYRYKVEAWIPSYLTDTTRKIITTPIEEFFKTTGNEAEGDLGESLGQVELAPDA